MPSHGPQCCYHISPGVVVARRLLFAPAGFDRGFSGGDLFHRQKSTTYLFPDGALSSMARTLEGEQSLGSLKCTMPSIVRHGTTADRCD